MISAKRWKVVRGPKCIRKHTETTEKEELEFISDISNRENSNVKLHTFSSDRKKRDSQMQSPLFYKGRIGSTTANVSCIIVLDNVCEEIVIWNKYAEKLELRREKTSPSRELWERAIVLLEQCCEKLNIRIGDSNTNLRPCVVGWITYDLFFRKLRHFDANLIINCN